MRELFCFLTRKNIHAGYHALFRQIQSFFSIKNYFNFFILKLSNTLIPRYNLGQEL